MLFVSFVLSAVIVLVIVKMIFGWYRKQKEWETAAAKIRAEYNRINSFSVAEYLGRIEQAQLEILEEQKPADQTVILWWGLDGLTLDENGALKWISRKKPEPVRENVFYQPCQSVLYADNYPVSSFGLCQNTQATINALQAQNAALQIQMVQQTQKQQIMQSMMMQQVNFCCARQPFG